MSSILYQVAQGVAHITLNRPTKFNAFNREMALQLQAQLDAASEDVNVRAIYITGAGKAFCAGQDIEELVGENKIEIRQILAEHYNPIVERIRAIAKPVVCAVNGVAAGAGANIALCCDIVVAHESSSFIQAFSKIGLVPDSGGTFTLPRLVGWQKASALMMLGDKVTAIDTEKMGMVYKVLPAESFETESYAIALQLAQMPTVALAKTKKLLNNSFNATWDEQLRFEDVAQQKCALTADYQEGINAFLEKRAPKFVGK